MKNNFIQMGASAGHAVAYIIGPSYFTNGLMNIVL